jgi:hypothetical protein
MAALAYWGFHLVVAVGGLLAWTLSWRVGLTLLFCLGLDLLLLVASAMPAPTSWNLLLVLTTVGTVVGLPLAIGKGRLSFWQLPALATGTMFLFQALLWTGALIDIKARQLAVMLPLVATAILGFPLGLLLAAACGRLWRVRRSSPWRTRS